MGLTLLVLVSFFRIEVSISYWIFRLVVHQQYNEVLNPSPTAYLFSNPAETTPPITTHISHLLQAGKKEKKKPH